jgi:hypothetical protein
MTDLEISAHVADCARAIRAEPRRNSRPATVIAICAELDAPIAIVWVVISANPGAMSYKFQFRRMDQYARPIMSTEGIALAMDGVLRDVTYWDVPPNVRDLGATYGARVLGMERKGWL